MRTPVGERKAADINEVSTRETRGGLLVSLRSLRFRVRSGAHPSSICSWLRLNNQTHGTEHLMLVRYLFPIWSEFSGDVRYPVKSPDHGFTPRDWFHMSRADDLWTREYGKSRRDLLDFLIWYLEDITDADNSKILE